jgi:hypothetical protein
MEKPKTMMLIASIIGAMVGIYYSIIANLLNNYFIFMALFAMAGVGAANLILLAVAEVQNYLRKNYTNEERTFADEERSQNAQTV